MANRREQKRPRKKHGKKVIPFSPPQTELDANVRNVLTHLVKHLGTITLPLGPLPEDGYIMWDVAQKQDGQKEMTVWWAESADERKAG